MGICLIVCEDPDTVKQYDYSTAPWKFKNGRPTTLSESDTSSN
jgi:hypothetical protein